MSRYAYAIFRLSLTPLRSFVLSSKSFEEQQTRILNLNTKIVYIATGYVISASCSTISEIWARMHQKVVGYFGSEADVRSLYYSRFRFNETSDVGAYTHGRPAK